MSELEQAGSGGRDLPATGACRQVLCSLFCPWETVLLGLSWGWGEVRVRKCSEGKRLQKCKLIERCGQSVLSGHRHIDQSCGPSDVVPRDVLFQSPHAEDLATTVAAREADVTISTAWEAEVTVSTAGEAEGGNVPTAGPALSMSTQDPGEGATPVSSLGCMLHFTSFWGLVGISVEAVTVKMWSDSLWDHV